MTAGAVGVTVGACVRTSARRAVAVGSGSSGALAVGVGDGVIATGGVIVGGTVVVAVAVAGAKTSGVAVADSCSPSASGLSVIGGTGMAGGGVAVQVSHGVVVGHGVAVADGWLVALPTNVRGVGVLLELGFDAARWVAGALPSTGTVVTNSKFIVGSGLKIGVPATVSGEANSGVAAGPGGGPCDG